MNVFPVDRTPNGKYIFIKLDVVLHVLVKDNMKEFEENYFRHTFGLSTCLNFNEGEYDRM